LLVVKEQFQHRIRDCLLIPELCCPLSLLGLAFDFQFWQLPDFGNFGTFLRPWWFNAILCDPCVLSGE
jgi:hypothetical protein